MHPLPALFLFGLLAVPARGGEAAAPILAPPPPWSARPQEETGRSGPGPAGHADPPKSPCTASVTYTIRIGSERSSGPRGAERARKRGAHMMLLRRLLLDKYDQNGDDLITGEERHALLYDARAAKAKALRELIARFDADGDGKLDAEELDRLQQAVRPAVRMHTAKRTQEQGNPPPSFEPVPPPPPDAGPVALLVRQLLIATYDADGDGRLSEAERQAVDTDAKALFDERTRALLARFDTDKDGKLDRTETEHARRILDEEREVSRELNASPARPDPIDLYLNTYYDMDVIRSLDAEPEP